MRSREVATILAVNDRTVHRLRERAGIGAPIGSGSPHRFSPGDVLAMYIVNELGGTADGESTFAEGACKCGEALDAGYPPAYLVTRGGAENVVVLESESPAQTDEMVASLLLQASDAGAAVRVVKLRPMVRALAPFLSELVDA